jgi:hypothetical protein
VFVMQKELEQIIKKYGLEGTRIQRGNRRLYPQREGLNATPEQLADLRSVLEGTSVKGFLEIKSGDVVIAANTGGAIEKAYDRSLIPSAQTELFKANTPVESRAKSPIEQDPVDSAMENVEQAQEVSQGNTVVAPPVVQTERKIDLDYPQDAQTLDPAANLKNTIAQSSATVKEKVLSATETLALAQKNMATFAKHVKHRGLKAWAKEQMPILQNKAKELVQAQAVKIGEYAKEQAPIVKDAAISGAKQVGETIVQFAKDQAPVSAEKAKAFGDAVVERIAEYTQLVDPVQVEQLGAHVLGNDGGFEGNTFDFKRGEKGVEISLKNGTPV